VIIRDVKTKIKFSYLYGHLLSRGSGDRRHEDTRKNSRGEEQTKSSRAEGSRKPCLSIH